METENQMLLKHYLFCSFSSR